jgi:hypothetical protein
VTDTPAYSAARGYEMPVINFYVWVLRIAIALALIGQLKSCTLSMMGLAAEKTERGMISYSKFSRLLNR